MFGKKKEPDKFIVVDCSFNCPKKPAEQGGCPKWVIMIQKVQNEQTKEWREQQVGKCAIAWIPELLVELNRTLSMKDTKQ